MIKPGLWMVMEGFMLNLFWETGDFWVFIELSLRPDEISLLPVENSTPWEAGLLAVSWIILHIFFLKRMTVENKILFNILTSVPSVG